MTDVNGNTVITMTLTQLLTGVGLVLGGGWLLLTFTQGNLKSDVADIRTALTETQDRNADTQQGAVAADGELRKQISDLTAELKITNTGLTNLTQSMAGLDESVKSVDARLASSVVRQEQFERWVVARLGQDATKPTAIPLDWQKAESDIVQSLQASGEPLSTWYKFIQQ